MAGLLLTGCAAQEPLSPVVNTPSEPQTASAALAFDAPITFDQAPINLWRDVRGPAAFMGFDQGTVSSFETFTDNRESNGYDSGYLRESFTEKTGSIHR